MTKAEAREKALRKQWGDKAYEFIDKMNSDEFVDYIRKAIDAGRGNDLRAYFEELADKEVEG